MPKCFVVEVKMLEVFSCLCILWTISLWSQYIFHMMIQTILEH